MLIASAYSGFIVWHGGLAGSIPLVIATDGHFTANVIGVIGTGETIFAFFNLAIIVALFIVVPLVNRMMLPSEEESVYVDPAILDDGPDTSVTINRPADHLENSRVLAWLVGFSGLAFIFQYFIDGGGLNLNIVNFLFLFLAIILHQTPKRLLASLHEAVKGGPGIVIQFPFYAGIMGVMTASGLAASISNGFVSMATAESLPFWSFISAGLVNIFVPSGGGQWAVQAPVMLPAAQELGASIPRVAWPLPEAIPSATLLGITGARYCGAQSQGHHGLLPHAADNHGRDHQRGPYLALRVHQPKTGGTSVAPGFVQGLWKIATSFRGTVIVQPRRSATSASVASR